MAVLIVAGVSKSYGAFQALSDVDLILSGGSIHALLGHNGAGKSTLINIICGSTVPSNGSLELDGQAVTFTGPRQAAEAGIAVIHQHLSLVDTLNVADNVFLGDEQSRNGLVERSEQVRRTRELLSRVGATCRATDLVAHLPMGQRQLVEIAKALHRDARVLILDEPTAALSDEEARRLGSLVLGLRAQGLAIVYVTHLLAEVERLADEVTVLEDGRVRFSGPAAGMSRSDLVGLISGPGTDPVTRPIRSRSRVALQTTRLAGPGFGPVDLQVDEGEIVALFGMLGSGRSELLESLAGARKVTSGRVHLCDVPFDPRAPRDAINRGVCFVAGDRRRQGLLRGRSVAENVLVGSRRAGGRWGIRHRTEERRVLSAVSREVRLAAPTSMPVDALSGGNQQKVVLARAFAATRDPKLLLLDGPTQGVDVRARADIYESLRALARERNAAILLSSSDPEEVLAVADRAVVIRAGVVESVVSVDEATEATLIALASHGRGTQ